MSNYWDDLMGDDTGAANYMLSYGEGPGSLLRSVIGEFINNGDSVLDAGCGPGWNLDHFMLHGPAVSRYKGTDYSERFVRVANARAKRRAGTSSGPYELGDVRDVKEDDLSWDVVIMQDCLEHTNGYDKPIQEALRVAKKRVILTFWHLTDKDEDNDINDDGNDGYGAWYSRSKLEKYLEATGYVWFHTTVPRQSNNLHDVYIIEKELK
jgi:ubiquinone/menaquinone biosynthesis C-methylase UbiE